jgi:hypothetical protein
LNYCTAAGFHASPPDHLIAPDHRIRFVTDKGLASPVLGTALLVYGPLSFQEQQGLGGVCFSRPPLARFLGRVFHAHALDLLGDLPTGGIDVVIADAMHGSCKDKANDPRYQSRGTPYDWGYDPANGDPEKHWFGDPAQDWCGHKVIYEECLRVLQPGGILAWGSSPKYAGKPGDGKYYGLNQQWFGPHTEWVLGRRGRTHIQFNAHLWLVQTKERRPYQGHLASPLIVYDKKPQMPKGYKPHPCSKPVEELLVVVSQLTKPGDVVLDCFCGLGSTLLACERLGRLWIGCDRSPNYCKYAMRELARVRRRQPS